MKQQSTHITLMNKKDRFECHFGDLMIVGVLFILVLILVANLWDVNRRFELFALMHSITYFVYFLFFEGVFGKTPVKGNDVRVVDLKGNKPPFWRILIRTIVRFVPFDSISFLFLKRGKGLHDILSGTQVVRKFKKK